MLNYQPAATSVIVIPSILFVVVSVVLVFLYFIIAHTRYKSGFNAGYTKGNSVGLQAGYRRCLRHHGLREPLELSPELLENDDYQDPSFLQPSKFDLFLEDPSDDSFYDSDDSFEDSDSFHDTEDSDDSLLEQQDERLLAIATQYMNNAKERTQQKPPLGQSWSQPVPPSKEPDLPTSGLS